MAAAVDPDRAPAQLHHQHSPLTPSPDSVQETRRVRPSSVPYAYQSYPARPAHPSNQPPKSHPDTRCAPQPSLTQPASPAKPPHAVLRPGSAAYTETRPWAFHPHGTYPHRPPGHHHVPHLSDPTASAPPRSHSPWTDPGPSTQSRRPSIQPSEVRSWQGDRRDPEKDPIPITSRSAAYSPEIVVVRSNYSGSDFDSFVSTSHLDLPTQKHRDTTLKALFKLSTIAPIVSFACLLYTLPVLLFLAITSPLKLCLSKSPAFKDRTLRYLTPPLNLQRALVYLPTCTPTISEGAAILPTDQSTYHTTTTPSSSKPSILIAVHLLSPFVAMTLMLTSWIVASFWALSAFIQDDAVEKKKGDDDGKAYAKKIVRCWRSWLDGVVLGGGSHQASSRGSRSSHGSRNTRPEMREQR